MSEVEGAPKRRHLDDGNHALDPSHHQAAEEGFSRIEKDNEDQFVEPLGSSRVMGSTWNIDSLDHQMKSTLVPNDVWERYLEHVEKMKRILSAQVQEDNRWVLKSWDLNGNELVKILCIECCKVNTISKYNLRDWGRQWKRQQD